MTDTGQVPGEGLPENAGGRLGQPHPADVHAPPADAGYTFVDGPETGGEEDDLLLMPGAQGAWSEQQAQYDPQMQMQYDQQALYEQQMQAAAAMQQQPMYPQPQEPGHGLYEGGVLDPGMAAYADTQMPEPQPVADPPAGPVTHPAPEQPAAPKPPPAPAAHAAPPTPPRRPLHMGPPVPDTSGGVVRSLADRGPAAGRHSAPRVQQPQPTPPPEPEPEYPGGVDYASAPEYAAGPQYFATQPHQSQPEDPGTLSGPQLADIPQIGDAPQPGDAWGPQPPAETVGLGDHPMPPEGAHPAPMDLGYADVPPEGGMGIQEPVDIPAQTQPGATPDQLYAGPHAVIPAQIPHEAPTPDQAIVADPAPAEAYAPAPEADVQAMPDGAQAPIAEGHAPAAAEAQPLAPEGLVADGQTVPAEVQDPADAAAPADGQAPAAAGPTADPAAAEPLAPEPEADIQPAPDEAQDPADVAAPADEQAPAPEADAQPALGEAHAPVADGQTPAAADAAVDSAAAEEQAPAPEGLVADGQAVPAEVQDPAAVAEPADGQAPGAADPIADPAAAEAHAPGPEADVQSAPDEAQAPVADGQAVPAEAQDPADVAVPADEQAPAAADAPAEAHVPAPEADAQPAPDEAQTPVADGQAVPAEVQDPAAEQDPAAVDAPADGQAPAAADPAAAEAEAPVADGQATPAEAQAAADPAGPGEAPAPDAEAQAEAQAPAPEAEAQPAPGETEAPVADGQAPADADADEQGPADPADPGEDAALDAADGQAVAEAEAPVADEQASPAEAQGPGADPVDAAAPADGEAGADAVADPAAAEAEGAVEPAPDEAEAPVADGQATPAETQAAADPADPGEEAEALAEAADGQIPADPAAPGQDAAPDDADGQAADEPASAESAGAEAPADEGAPEAPDGEAPEDEATDAAPEAEAADEAPEAEATDQEAGDQEDQEDQEPTDQEDQDDDEPVVIPLGPRADAGYDDAERAAVHRVMRERRDIRNGFRPDPIPHEVLLRVLEAAHTAPSVGQSQPWDFVVIRSEETRRTMHELAARQRDAYAKSLPKGRAKQFKELKIEAILETPINILVTADPTRGGRHTLGRHTQPQMAPYSSALAVENLWLAARAEGLGVGWVSFFDEREMVRTLGLPDHLEAVAYLCVGYVDEFPEEPELLRAGWSKRRPLSWVVHEETYGRRALPGEDPHNLLTETLQGIRPLDAKALGEAWERQKRMTKPSGALGMLEIISAQLSGLSRQCPPPIPEPAAVAIFAGDHGVHAQGVTAWPQEVTAQMVANFLGGGAVCNAFASQVGAEVCVVDVGVTSELPSTPGLLPRKVRAGTGDFTTGPALTREEVLRALEVGIETARDLVAAGNKALLTGEMGIANTTTSAALVSVYTGADPAEVTGRGTGINDEMHARKIDVVRRGLELHQPDPADPIGVLCAFGGLEHAAMAGLLLGGASLRTPVILDGVSAGAAALVARAIAPEVLAACIAGHRSAEPGHVAALNKLGLRPLVDLDLRLGEGTGALLALPVVQSAARAMHEVATFDSAGVTEKN
ncbi:nicotinate-nucleotide--dimethylbenzimidazole phosphoribosyltransferase [Streptomyces sp. NPDC021098]|uniref:nicotinate-nucleotide--dimethylbenzimidazole phosphoribosyltransferase n=1 Tax=unclassified Streptomyces TaxID=2593676 RepID=UPI0037AADDA8